ncbi:MAG: R3H domain-containing nucleic acid-binding protein, partial [Ardenticatenaceae bacterium]
LNLPVTVASELSDARMLLTLRSYYRKRPQVIADAERRGITVYVLRSNTVAQMEGALTDIFGIKAQLDPFEQALRETHQAIEEVRRGASSVELSPQAPYVRRHQHDLARAAKLFSRSKGKEPNRRVRIYANNSV